MYHIGPGENTNIM